MERLLYGLLVCCLLTAGCITGGPGGSGVSSPGAVSPDETPTATAPPPATPTGESTSRPDPTPVMDLASAGIACHESLTMNFWGLNEDSFWTQESVRVGFYLPPNTSILLVTYVDGTMQGVRAETNTYDDGINTDGDELDLNSSFSGTHLVRTVVYRDSGRDGQFEKGVDRPCLEDGDLVQAGPKWVDFSRFG